MKNISNLLIYSITALAIFCLALFALFYAHMFLLFLLAALLSGIVGIINRFAEFREVTMKLQIFAVIIFLCISGYLSFSPRPFNVSTEKYHAVIDYNNNHKTYVTRVGSELQEYELQAEQYYEFKYELDCSDIIVTESVYEPVKLFGVLSVTDRLLKELKYTCSEKGHYEEGPRFKGKINE